MSRVSMPRSKDYKFFKKATGTRPVNVTPKIMRGGYRI